MVDFTVLHNSQGNLVWIRANNSTALKSMRTRYICRESHAHFARLFPFRPEDLPSGFTYEIVTEVAEPESGN